MYLYLSEHQLMDYHLNTENKTKEAEKPKEQPEPNDGTSTDRAE